MHKSKPQRFGPKNKQSTNPVNEHILRLVFNFSRVLQGK